MFSIVLTEAFLLCCQNQVSWYLFLPMVFCETLLLLDLLTIIFKVRPLLACRVASFGTVL